MLTDPQKKINYDKWRNSGIAIGYKQWLGMKEHVHQVCRVFSRNLILRLSLKKINTSFDIVCVCSLKKLMK